MKQEEILKDGSGFYYVSKIQNWGKKMFRQADRAKLDNIQTELSKHRRGTEDEFNVVSEIPEPKIEDLLKPIHAKLDGLFTRFDGIHRRLSSQQCIECTVRAERDRAIQGLHEANQKALKASKKKKVRK